jgi:DNA replication licensing factor MCM3
LYASLRKKAANSDQNKISQPVTVRTLETIIRLSTAHAKLRFSKVVELSDVDVAITMLKEAIFQEHLEKKEVIQENEEMEEDEPEVEVVKQRPLNRRARADPIEAVPEPPTKKMRTDPEDQVT